MAETAEGKKKAISEEKISHILHYSQLRLSTPRGF